MMKNHHIPTVYASVYGSVYACPFVYASFFARGRRGLRKCHMSTLAKTTCVDTKVDTETRRNPPHFHPVYSFYSYLREKREREKNEDWGRNTRARVDCRHTTEANWRKPARSDGVEVTMKGRTMSRGRPVGSARKAQAIVDRAIEMRRNEGRVNKSRIARELHVHISTVFRVLPRISA